MVRYTAYVGILPESSLARIRSESYTTPLGQIILGTTVQQKFPKTEVIIFDPVRTSLKEMWNSIETIHSRHENVLVGLSLLSGNTDHGFEFARKCYDEGTDVAIGGPEVSGYGAKNIMSTRPYITYGVDSLGERILSKLIGDENLSKVPGIAYWKDNELTQNATPTECNTLDWSHVEVDYSLLHNLTGNVGTTYLTGNDCFISGKRCYFCGRLGMGNPKTENEIETRITRAWKEIETAWDAGLTHYFNSADSALRSPVLFKTFADAMPEWFQPEFHHLFANAHEVTEEVIPLLKKLNATVYLGVENAAIENHGKGKIRFNEVENKHSLLSSRRAIALMHEHEIPMRLSFVFGSVGETKDTLKKNLDTIVEMVQRHPTITDLELNPIEVLPGTQAFHDLMKEKKEKYSEKDVPYNTLEMSKDLVPLVSEVTRDEVLEWISKMYAEVRKIKPEIRVNTKGISKEEFRYLGGDEII